MAKRGPNGRPEKCTVNGCGKKYLANGWCAMHNWRMSHWGFLGEVGSTRKPRAGRICKAIWRKSPCDREVERGDLCRRCDIILRRHKDPAYDTTPSHDSRGYIFRWMDGKRVFEHRRRAEIQLGRPLVGKENIHHRNGIRSDNSIGPCLMDRECKCRTFHNLEYLAHSPTAGQRPKDLLQFARGILLQYGNFDSIDELLQALASQSEK